MNFLIIILFSFFFLLLLLLLLPHLRRKCFLAPAVLRCIALNRIESNWGVDDDYNGRGGGGGGGADFLLKAEFAVIGSGRFFFFLSFLNWGTCTCMERRGEEVEDDDDEELLGWGDWLPLA